MAATRGFLGLPVISLFLFFHVVFCNCHERNCSTLAKGYYSDSNLRPSSLKDLLLPPFYISSRAKPWRRIASTIRLPQSVWTKHGYSCLSASDLHFYIDITILMDVSSNPGPGLNQSSLSVNGLSVLYLNSRSLKALLCLSVMTQPLQRFARLPCYSSWFTEGIMMFFVFVRPGSITLLWIVSCFMATLSIEGIEKDASAAVYWSLLKLTYRPFAFCILRKRTPNWSWLKLKR